MWIFIAIYLTLMVSTYIALRSCFRRLDERWTAFDRLVMIILSIVPLLNVVMLIVAGCFLIALSIRESKIDFDKWFDQEVRW